MTITAICDGCCASRSPATGAIKLSRIRLRKISARERGTSMKGEGLRELARFAARTNVRTLPPEVVEKGRACLLYGMAVGVACMRVDQPAQAARAVSGVGAGAATRFFDDAKCDAGLAAFANGS